MSDNARLILGDALDVLPTLPPSSADFIFADPPYGHKNNDAGDLISRWEAATGQAASPAAPRPILNDGDEADDLFRAFLTHARRLLCEGSCCCCCGGGGGPDPQFARWALWMGEALSFKQMVVWDKGKMGMGWHYRRSYETVLVAQKGSGRTRWYDRTRKVENIIRPGAHGISKIIPGASDHPTAKPVELAMHFIRLHTRPGDVVLDPFMGSGTTGVAALRLGRRFVGIELDPTHYKAAERRIDEVVADPPLFAQPQLFDAEEKPA